jgi:hypothetical protein
MQALRALCVSWVMVGVAGAARAEDPRAPAPSPAAVAVPRSVAIGSNLPLLWKDGDTIAGSLYVNVSDRHAIRANVASYGNHGPILKDTLAGLAGGDSISYHGRITDLGLSWIYYPRRVWQGLLLEAGALRRAREVRSFDSDRAFASISKRSTVHAGRAMVGWSWLLYGHCFIAAAAGLSVGWESGTEVSRHDYDDVMKTDRVARPEVTGEAYLRVGAVFDL